MTAFRSTASTSRSQSKRRGRWRKAIGRSPPISTSAPTTSRPKLWARFSPARLAADGGVCADDRQESRREEGPDHIPDRRQAALSRNPRRAHIVRRSAADHSSERRDVGEYRPSDQSRKAGSRRRRVRKYL